MTLSPSRAAPSARLIVTVLAACLIALGITVSPLTTTSAQAAGPLQNLFFQADTNRNLDLGGGSSNDGTAVETYAAQTGHAQSWRLNVNPADSTFTIVNNSTGKCIDKGSSPNWYLTEWSCRGQSSQRWYVQPVQGDWKDFMFRQVDTGQCMDLFNGNDWDTAWVGQYSCNGTPNQDWSPVIPGGQITWVDTTAYAALRNLAVDYAANKCQQDTSTCYWVESSESPAAPLPSKCVSAVWYNSQPNPFPYAFSVQDMTGWSNTAGTELSTSLETGKVAELVAKVSVTLKASYSHTWSGSSTVSNSVTIPAQPGMYNYVALSLLATKVTGTWTFDVGGYSWTADDTITVPLANNPSGGPGTTVYQPVSTPTWPTCN
ncbi:hypothetical protein P3T37_000906 [Kitasatospora sp. MAA4]|uniref:RICIN domain-containing protein n=1 Tax=Kitasatospora sp. MAA4 TaxID=3035093 RepID=UPI0024743CF1|nr:RICIN domain-containing protein [Kitasatospora sp. MAA4]MDH6131537.1 hypothetical protein [Kitasatospora sp. MAA4]